MLVKPKIVLLGSGALSIGQAGEFDYSGSQAIRAFEDEGYEVIVINPNIATVQTDPANNRRIYFYPITKEYVEKVIQKEKPFAIVGGFGGQTALNCLIDLDKSGILEKYNVKSLGTAIETLEMTEDRELFAQKLKSLDVSSLSYSVYESLEGLKKDKEKFSYPVISRSAYALGGLGSGFADNYEELETLVSSALSINPQVIIEKSLFGWKEIEYEVLRDSAGNTICICNMENLDPLGVHTGDSIVVAPSQTINDEEYQVLRDVSIKIVNSLNIVGECNVQFALNPETLEYYVIEINARLSRSSALASKATGYPIAYLAAKVVCGKLLSELKNPVTETTCAFFEPALDYVTVKFPKWDLDKFHGSPRGLGSKMKSVGEVMAIGRNFPETFQKAVRMVLENDNGLLYSPFKDHSNELLEQEIKSPTDKRIYAVLEALRRNYTVDEIFNLSKITHWFLFQLQRIVVEEFKMKNSVDKHSLEDIYQWKKLGFSDSQIVSLLPEYKNKEKFESQLHFRNKRKDLGVIPYIKKIDTTASEYPSPSNYLYMTYDGSSHDLEALDKSTENVLILGSGSYRIGSSVEFDWCGVTTSDYLRESGRKSIVLNCNPETVSTDFSTSDQLFFEELSIERIMDIYDFENIDGIISCMGGQLPNCIVPFMDKVKLPILGHSCESLENAESRTVFSKILDNLNIDQPKWVTATSKEDIDAFIEEIGFPILIRPSFVLSGTAMKVVYNKEQLDRFLSLAVAITDEYPTILTQFLSNTHEFELDGVSKNGEVVTSIVSQHIENAGVHSGDATIVVPNIYKDEAIEKKLKNIGQKIADSLKLNGPFNIQFLVNDETIKVIECNVRASRSFPFVSKVRGVNLARIAAQSILNDKIESVEEKTNNLYGVKAAMFSFARLEGVDPILGVEMSSTGEVGCISENYEEALLLAMESTNIRKPSKGIIISTGNIFNKNKWEGKESLLKALDVPIYATSGTYEHLTSLGVECSRLKWEDEGSKKIAKMISDNQVDLVINIPKGDGEKEFFNNSLIRQTASRSGVSLITNNEKAIAFMKALNSKFEDKLYSL